MSKYITEIEFNIGDYIWNILVSLAICVIGIFLTILSSKDIGIGLGIFLLLLGLGLLAYWFIKYLSFSKHYVGEKENNLATIETTDNMEGHDFEYWCADILRQLGFVDVEVTRGSGDQGTDILAIKDGKSYAIQCKRFLGNVGNKAVQEAIAGREYYKKDIAVVMTNSGFTTSAKELAEKTGVKLWDRKAIEDMLRVLNITK